jgi:hypothetical protein
MYIFVMLSQFSLHIYRYTIYIFFSSVKYYTWTLWIAPCCHHWFLWWWWCCCCFYCIER